jgi:hypothetical protein
MSKRNERNEDPNEQDGNNEAVDGAAVGSGRGPVWGVGLDALRLSQDYTATLGITRKIVEVPVQKPNRQSFIRCRGGEEWRIQIAVLELKEEREHYLVHPGLLGDLSGEVVAKVLVTSIDRQDNVFLWPIRLPGLDGRIDSWNRGALEIAKLAEESWVRVVSNMGLRSYEAHLSHAELTEPNWPDLSLTELIETAFKGRFIDSLDDPIVKRLRGAL